jgi:hypothetical protein
MSFNLDSLFIEWRRIVPTGVPNPKNAYHLTLLKEICLSKGISTEIVDSVMLVMEKEEKFTARSKKTGNVAAFGSEEARDKAIEDGGYEEVEKKDDGDDEEKEPTKKMSIDANPFDKEDKKGDIESTDEKPKERIINGKNKTLKKINSSETETFSEDIEPSDEDFSNDLKIPEPPSEFEIPEELNKGKFPKKYTKLISRMMNSKRVGTKPEISTLISKGGAGAISAQAGEVLTMMATSMSDDEWESLQNSMLDHEKSTIENNPDLKAPGKRVINKSWILAAGKSRKAIRDRIMKKYGEGVEISNTAWDTEEDVNAMGWDNYNGSKGFSTDMYVKVTTKDGEDIMDEVSLKKDVKINFLNSSTGKFREWDGDSVGSEIDAKEYSNKERDSLNKAIEEFGLDLPKPTSRKSAKAVWMAMVEKTDYDTKTGKMTTSNPPTREEEWVQSHVKQIRDYTANATRAVVDNPKLKAGMLKDIRKEFPLKSVGEGEETMAIGDLSLDPDTMKELFGTSDFEKIKENLVVNEDVDPPALAYKAGLKGEMFNVASIVIRQDGVGYGGSSMKFEMQMDKEFANKLKDSHKKVYG